jgi:hypothetical protein
VARARGTAASPATRAGHAEFFRIFCGIIPLTSPATRAGLCICGSGVSLPTMAFHKFKIGQRVIYQPLGNKFPTRCVVTALLPERNGDFKYQIRRQGWSADLVVGEGDIRENR